MSDQKRHMVSCQQLLIILFGILIGGVYFFLCLNTSKIEANKRHSREVLLFAFNSKKSAVEARRMIVETYGEASISERTCRDGVNATKVVISTCKQGASRTEE